MASPGPRRLRSTMDSVLIHDMKNLGLRLNLLLANVEEHYGEPEFKGSVTDLLRSTAEKLDAIAAHWSAHRDAVMIKVPLEPNDLLREVLRGCRPRGRTPVAVATRFGDVPPVWGDPYNLRDAFLSIVQNALEAAASSVAVSTERQTAGGKEFVVVRVADDGPGMPTEFVRRRLFRPFETTKPGGVGLGLYTARRIVRHHRGEISVKSAVGKGTCVAVRLPAHESPADRTAP